MSRDTDWAALYGDHPGDDSSGRSRPPIWVVVVVVAAVVTGGWMLVTQGSSDGDSVAGTTIPFEPLVVTSTTVSLADAAPVLSLYGNPPAAVTSQTSQLLRGYVAVTSPDDPPFLQYTVWMFRPGGSVVSRADNVIGRGDVEYPMLITAGHLILGGRIFDIDLSEPPISLWTNGFVIPGSGPGVVWLVRRVERITGDNLWVLPVDVESLTVGERFDVSNLFSRPIAGVADGLIVVDLEGEMAYWSPTDGIVPLDLPDNPVVVAASGNLVIVDDRHVNVLDIASGEYVSSFERPDIRRPVTSACLSPDGQHVIVVAWTGQAFVGNTTTGEIIDLNAVNDQFPIQQEHGIGWTTDDQLVFIGEGEDAKHILGFDVATGESFDMATLEGSDDWWLTASGTMC